MKRLLPALTLFAACNFNPDARLPIEAAREATRHYAAQALKAYAAGDDCRVLLVRARTALDHATVETLHYGTGESPAQPGGLQQFAEHRKFRAVAYRDADGGLWTYGSITRNEAQSMPLCR